MMLVFGPYQTLGVELLESHPNAPLPHSSHHNRNRTLLPEVNKLLAKRDPRDGLEIVPLPTRKLCRYLSPAATEPSCILFASVGVYQRNVGGLAELAALMKSEVETLLPAKIFGLLPMLAYAVNGKWSFPLGQPDSQKACQVPPIPAISFIRLVTGRQQPYPSDTP